MKYKHLKFFFVLLFCLSTIQFFTPVFFSLSLLYYTYYLLFFATLIAVVVNFRTSRRNTFIVPIIVLLVAQTVSAFAAFYSWEQNLGDSFKAVLPYMGYLLFLFLVAYDFTALEVERLFIILAISYIVVYFITYTSYPTQIFGDVDQYDDERGFQRISTSGIGCLCLFSFYSLSQYIVKKKLYSLIIYIVTLVCIIMTLSRTLIIISLLFSLLFIIRKSSTINKLIAIAATIFFMNISSQINFANLLVKQTKSELDYGKDNIRMQAVDFYFQEFSPNTFSKIFGNGEAYQGTTYSAIVSKNETILGLYSSDVGYIGFYSKFGLLAILAFAGIIYKTFRIKVSDEYIYTKYFLYLVFVGSIILDAPFNNNFIPSIVLALYILSVQDNNAISKEDYDSNTLILTK